MGPTNKIVDGVRIELTPQEIQDITDRWNKNILKKQERVDAKLVEEQANNALWDSIKIKLSLTDGEIDCLREK